jgi:hypothetical protein
MPFRLTEQMCLITVPDANREDGYRHVDLGNYYMDDNNRKCLVTTAELADKYYRYVRVPMYIRKKIQ